MTINSGNTLFIDYFLIRVIGDTEIYAKVFNSVAMFYQGTGGKMLDAIIYVAITFFLLMSGWNFMHNKITKGLFITQAVLSLMIITSFNVKCTMTIEDGRKVLGVSTSGNQGTIIVDNVPYILAVSSALSSLIGFELVRVFQDPFTLDPTAPQYMDYGFMKHLTYTQVRTQVFDSNPEVKDWGLTLKKYVRECFTKYGNEKDMEIVNDFNLDKLNPAELDAVKDDPSKAKRMVTSFGRDCSEYYDSLIGDFNALQVPITEAIKKSLNTNSVALGKISDMMSEDLAFGLKSNASPFPDYINATIQPYLTNLVKLGISSSSLGVGSGVTGSTALANAEAYITNRRFDGASLGTWIAGVYYLELGINLITIIVYLIFPIVMLFCLFLSFESQKKYLKSYFVGLITVGLYPFSFMILHSVCSYYTNQNIAQKLLSNSKEAIINSSYYAIIADMAMVSTFMGIIIALALPRVIVTGAVDALFNTLGRLYPAGVGNANSYLQQAASAQADASVAESQGIKGGVGELTISQQLAQAYSMASNKLGDWSIMNDPNNSGRMAVLDALKQANIQSARADGSIGKEAEFLASGQYQGYSDMASQAKIGQTMIDGHEWNNGRNKVSGRTLATGAGEMQGAGAVASALAAAESKIIGQDGIAGVEGNAYTQGLINQARIQQNQTIGVGKEGTFTSQEMANIQALSASQVRSNIAQGGALKSVYGGSGSGGSALGDKYDKDAETLALEKVKQMQANATALRNVFGENLGSRSKTLYNNAEQKYQSEKGSADSYKEAKNEATGEGIKVNPAYATAYSSNYNALSKSTKDNVNRIKEQDKAIRDHNELKLKAEASNFVKNDEKVKEAQAVLSNLKQELKNESLRSINSLTGLTGVSEINKISNEIKSAEAGLDGAKTLALDAFYAKANVNDISKGTEVNHTLKNQLENLKNLGEDLSTASAMQLQKMSADIQTGRDMGTVGTTGYTSAGLDGLRIQSHVQHNALLSNVSTFNNAQAIDSLASGLGMSDDQRRILRNSRDAVERSRNFRLMTQGSTLQGQFGNIAFNANIGDASVSTKFSGAINSQLSRSFGVTVNAGEASSWMAYEGGNMRVLEGVGVAGAGFNLATSLSPKGIVGKGLNNLSKIGGKGGGSGGGGIIGGGGSLNH